MRERWRRQEERTGGWLYSIQRKTGDMGRTERTSREETLDILNEILLFS